MTRPTRLSQTCSKPKPRHLGTHLQRIAARHVRCVNRRPTPTAAKEKVLTQFSPRVEAHTAWERCASVVYSSVSGVVEESAAKIEMVGEKMAVQRMVARGESDTKGEGQRPRGKV